MKVNMLNPTRQDQTTLANLDPSLGQFGNCIQASIASILGLHMNAVPPFEVGFWDTNYDWRAAVTSWAEKKHKLRVTICTGVHPDGMALACGATGRGISHCVVYQDGKLWHDPHPSRAGLIAPNYWVIFTLMEDSNG
jgi:hypothetical protein